MERKEAYGEKAMEVSVKVSIRDLEKCVAIAKYFNMSSSDALHYVIRRGIECVWCESERPEGYDG